MNNILKPDEVNFGKTEIPVNSTWDVMDATKIKTLMSCPRDFFYSYIMGWRHEGSSIHLAYGHAWHQAMEVLLTEGTTPEAVAKAYQSFLTDYVSQMEQEADILQELHPSKTPSAAALGLAEYAKLWQDDPKETLHLEVSGTAPIDESGRVIHVKLDAIRRRKDGPNAGKIHSLEHKTTTRFTEAWQEQWHYDFQVGAYDHFLKCLYEPEEVEGVIINGAVFNKTSRKFPRFPIIRSNEMWEMWIYEANHWWNYLEMNMRHLYETSASDRVMVAFPRNSASCSKFGCKHPQLCCFKANPLQRIETPPLGYKVDFWDPREREKEAKEGKGGTTVSVKTTVSGT